MIDTNNIVAIKPVPVMQEVPATVNSERVSAETRNQHHTTEQVQTEQQKKKETAFDSKLAGQMVDQLNEDLKIFNTRIAFSIDDQTKKTVVKIIDQQNNQVIRQIPPEYMLKISQRISELLGIVVDQKA